MLSWLFSTKPTPPPPNDNEDGWELVADTYASVASKPAAASTTDLRRKTLAHHETHQHPESDVEPPEEDAETDEDFTDALRRKKAERDAEANELLNELGGNNEFERKLEIKAYLSRKTRRRLKKEAAAAKKSMS
ncbi:hypothetical protein HDU98_008429 [Podochytrium sp. JEL0797]|nr:hypothetical protein HDU98_008429 [Podochytrium sp. JEL0797]